MENPRLDGMRECSMVLQRQEADSIRELMAFAGSDRARMRRVIHVLKEEMWGALMEAARLRQRIDELLQGGGLGDVFDVRVAEDIVACRQRLADIHAENNRRIREELSRQ